MNTIMAWYHSLVSFLSTDAGKLKAWGYLEVLLCLLVALVLILILMYYVRTRQVRNERSTRYRISRFLSHLLATYDAVEEVDVKRQTLYRYVVKDGKAAVDKEKFEKVTDLFGEIHPGDQLKYSPETLRTAVERAMKTCTASEFTMRVKDADDSFHWVAYLIQGFKRDKNHNRDCLLLSRRIDEQKSQEMEKRVQLNSAMNRARDDAETKGKFMSRISRDMREALNSIMGYLTLAGAEENTEQRREYVQGSQEQVRYLLSVLNDVIDLSAMENGTMALRNEPFELDPVLEKLENLFREEAQRRHIEFDMDNSAVRHLYLKGDRVRFEQVMMNLLANAMLFTGEKNKLSCVLGRRDQKNKKVVLEVNVSCSGKTIPEELLDKVFLPYEMVSQLERSSFHGGLGLVVTHNLVHVLGGVIKADNNSGEGVRFIMELPFTYHEAPPADPNRMPLAGKRILVADDNDLSAQVLEKMLSNTGIIMERAKDGREACELFGKSDPGYYSAILMDLDMPSVDGCEAASLIRMADHADAKSIPILALTENLLSEDVAAALNSGMNGEISKPIERDSLLSTLETFIK
jgi:signal transduction histidine kinase/ActR/RegA family two-component response regulator